MSRLQRVGSVSFLMALLGLFAVRCAQSPIVQWRGGTSGGAGEAGAFDDGGGGAPGSGGDPGSSADGGAGPSSSSEASGGSGTGGASGGTGGQGTGGTGQLVDPPDEPALEFIPFTLSDNFETYRRATDFGFVPTRPDELLVLWHGGLVEHYRLTEAGLELLGSVEIPDIFFDEGCGLLSLAFDPDFENNQFIYLSRCRQQTESVITRHRFRTLEEIPETEVDIVSVTEEVAEEDWHRFGSMGFEPDGETMWALLGDLFIRTNAQDTTKKAGSLLRFIPNRSPNGSGHEPASGNAFDSEDEGDPTIYAYGLRSPWRGALDRFGRFWVGDVGLYTTEEVDLVTAAGQNLGWDSFEGPCDPDCGDTLDPLTSYGRLADEPYVVEDPLTEPATRRAIWVSQPYENPSTDRYYGLFDDSVMFGDFFTGWVRQLKVDEEGELVVDRSVGHLTEVTSWRTGPDGYMYLLAHARVLFRAQQVLPTQ